MQPVPSPMVQAGERRAPHPARRSGGTQPSPHQTGRRRAPPTCARRSLSLPQDDRAKRSGNDPGIEGEALVPQVPELVLQLLEGIELAGAIGVLHLRPARQAGTDEVTEVVEGNLLGELLDVLRLLGSGPDQ